MSKKTEALSDALGGVDDELLYQTQLVRAKKPARQKRSFFTLTAVAVAGLAVGLLFGSLPMLDGGSLQGTVVELNEENGWMFIRNGKPLTGVQENLPGWEDYRFTFGADGVLQCVEKRAGSDWQVVWQADGTGSFEAFP